VGFKGLITAAAAVALVAAPTMAAAQSVEVAPASESVNEGSELRGGFIIPLIALVAIILGILAATQDDDDDLPQSP
jgi:glycerol uptake facilitator-like aquaporin